MSAAPSQTFRDAWAKLSDDGTALPLWLHGADAAAVLLSLLDEPAWRERLQHCAGRSLGQQDISRLLVLAFLHDLGKTNYGFWERQFPNKPLVGHTNETAALIHAPCICDHPAAMRLVGLIEEWDAFDLFFATMAHHGRPLAAYAGSEHNPDLGREARDLLRTNRHPAAHWLAQNGYDPMAQLARLLDAARERFPDAFVGGPALPSSATFVSLFCGLMTLVDWLASDASVFAIGGTPGPEHETMRRAASSRAVAQRGLGALATPACTFAAAFAVPGPRGLQASADQLDLGPIVLLEAETGSGKTEAALWRWLALRRAGQVDGLYFALPTRSAAVQLHRRVRTMLDRVFGRGVIEAVLAVPGYLRAGDAEGQALPEFRVLWPDDGAGDGRWAAERPKRFLAARVAVGTIDQVLLAGLQRRHAHLRAAALSRSLLVVDEVHASDAFMGEVLAQVLLNHQAFGGHAFLLSATLTADARSRLLGRPESLDLEAARTVRYPALFGATRDPAPMPTPAPKRVGKLVTLETWPYLDGANEIAGRAVAAAGDGASVLVVRNSVAGAVAVARMVEELAPELAFRVGSVATLHHGRFAPSDRRLLDAAVDHEFGRKRDARGRILCGTQTLEQSLDIDADLLITDLAPMDVLLQRIGRLHRHQRGDRGTFGAARAVILVPAHRDLSAYLDRMRDRHGLGPIRNGQGVYPDLLVLEATLRLIEANLTIEIPADNRRLVEGALHPQVAEDLMRALGKDWINHASVQDGIAAAERGLARRWRLDLSAPFGSLLFPDQDEVVATRLGARDRLLDFDPPFPGPFGQAVGRLTVPGWMAMEVAPETKPTLDAADATGTSFHLGECRFQYGRWGLQSIEI